MDKSIALVCAHIRRDPHTATPTYVLEHELAILRDVYGKENVEVADPCVDIRVVDADSEYERLSGKYGLTIIEEVYGRESSGRFEEAIDRAARNAEDGAAPLAKRRGRRPAQSDQAEGETSAQ